MKLFAPLEDLKLLISTSDEDRLSALDGVRALALLWVFALHSAQIPMWVPPSSMKISEARLVVVQSIRVCQKIIITAGGPQTTSSVRK